MEEGRRPRKPLETTDFLHFTRFFNETFLCELVHFKVLKNDEMTRSHNAIKWSFQHIPFTFISIRGSLTIGMTSSRKSPTWIVVHTYSLQTPSFLSFRGGDPSIVYLDGVAPPIRNMNRPSEHEDNKRMSGCGENSNHQYTAAPRPAAKLQNLHHQQLLQTIREDDSESRSVISHEAFIVGTNQKEIVTPQCPKKVVSDGVWKERERERKRGGHGEIESYSSLILENTKFWSRLDFVHGHSLSTRYF